MSKSTSNNVVSRFESKAAQRTWVAVWSQAATRLAAQSFPLTMLACSRKSGKLWVRRDTGAVITHVADKSTHVALCKADLKVVGLSIPGQSWVTVVSDPLTCKNCEKVIAAQTVAAKVSEELTEQSA